LLSEFVITFKSVELHIAALTDLVKQPGKNNARAMNNGRPEHRAGEGDRVIESGQVGGANNPSFAQVVGNANAQTVSGTNLKPPENRNRDISPKRKREDDQGNWSSQTSRGFQRKKQPTAQGEADFEDIDSIAKHEQFWIRDV
jgi:hypothetical protein